MKINPYLSIDTSHNNKRHVEPHNSHTFSESITNAFEKLENSLKVKKTWSPQELIHVQMQAHRLQLTVECTSKLADGISSTVRKLQSPQG